MNADILTQVFGASARIKTIRLLMVVGAIILLDQFSKMIILQQVPLFHMIPVIPGFFNITHIHNPGGAFGFMAGQGPEVRTFLFQAMSILAAVFIAVFYYRTPSEYRWLSFGLLLILGGAIGNMIDRFRFGEVVDFLDFYIKGYHWPAFNVADSGITVGMVILVLHLLFNKMPD